MLAAEHKSAGLSGPAKPAAAPVRQPADAFFAALVPHLEVCSLLGGYLQQAAPCVVQSCCWHLCLSYGCACMPSAGLMTFCNVNTDGALHHLCLHVHSLTGAAGLLIVTGTSAADCLCNIEMLTGK